MNPTGPRRVRTLDVRPMMKRGEEPRAKVVAAITALAADESLALVTPFVPSPMIERMRGDGFQVRPERRADGAWQTLFWRD